MKRIINYLTEKGQEPIEHHNENTFNWSKGYKKAFHETLEFVSNLKEKDKRVVVITLLVITLLFSTILILHHNRDSPININNASVEALESLPGIGETLANRIIQGRPYKDIYELDRVKGIGPEKIKAIDNKVVAK